MDALHLRCVGRLAANPSLNAPHGRAATSGACQPCSYVTHFLNGSINCDNVQDYTPAE